MNHLWPTYYCSLFNELEEECFSFYWLFFSVHFNRRATPAIRDALERFALTTACKSSAMSQEIQDIIWKNEDDWVKCMEKISDYFDEHDWFKEEHERGEEVCICDAPGMNYFKEQQLKNKLKKAMDEIEDDGKMHIIVIDDDD